MQLIFNLDAIQLQVRRELGRVKILFRLGLVVPLLIWAVPLLIWWVGGKMNPRIRLTSAKVGVGVEVEAELGNIKTLKIKSQCN